MEQDQINSITKDLSKADLIQLRTACQKRIDEILIQDREDAKKQKITALKTVNRGDSVYYVGRYIDSYIPYAKKCIKIKDNRKNMTVSVDGKQWSIPYESLSPVKPTDKEAFNMMKKILS